MAEESSKEIQNKPIPQKVSANPSYYSIEEARNCIKTKFLKYHHLLDQKETLLIEELNLLEESNKPQLLQVTQDLSQLCEVIGTLDKALGANTLKPFLEEQKSVLTKQISHFERAQELLTCVTLRVAEFENLVDKVIEIVPFLSKAKYRAKLEPLLNREPKHGENWNVVSKEWFSRVKASIHLDSPQPNDSWEFPESIPVNHSDILNGNNINTENCELLHSKGWELLLQFHGLAVDSSPISRRVHLNRNTNKICIPLHPIKHKCIIGHNSADSKFNNEVELEAFPSETFKDIKMKLSGYAKLYTKYPIRLYCIEITNTVTCNQHFTEYIIQLPNNNGQPGARHHLNPTQASDSTVGLNRFAFLVIIPDSVGNYNIQVVSNIPNKNK